MAEALKEPRIVTPGARPHQTMVTTEGESPKGRMPDDRSDGGVPRGRRGMSPPKYPRTSYWPSSPSIVAGDRTTPCPEEFLGVELVITEKLDGSNILLHQGQVYARSTSGGPATAAPWLAMVRKHHAWKLAQPGCKHILLYGEDLYGVHAIEYGPMREDHTFRVFASMRYPGTFDSFRET